jgi:hypothetical protein
VSHVWYSIEKSNGRRARIVGQGDPKTRDRPAAENGISPLNVAFLSGWRRSLGENMHTPMTPWAEASLDIPTMHPRKSITRPHGS